MASAGQVPGGEGWVEVCESAVLDEGGEGVRFEVACAVDGDPPSPQPAFVVRFDGQVRAFLNRCAHVPVELDFQSGRFFDDSCLYLVCATHGALYDPADGNCVAGPCPGQALRVLEAVECGGRVYARAGT